MKNKRLAGWIALFLFTGAAIPSVANPLLSEIFYDATGSTDDGLEWIELYNPTASAIDLSGYSLGNGGADYTYSTVQLSGILSAFSYFLVGGTMSVSTNYNPSLDQSVNFSPDLQNSGTDGDAVALFNVTAANIQASSVPIDAVIYGPNNNNNLFDETGSPGIVDVADAAAGSSIERTDLSGSWQVQSSPSPGTGNLQVPEPATCALLGSGFLLLAVRRTSRKRHRTHIETESVKVTRPIC